MDLSPFVAALAELGDDELHTLIATTNAAPQVAPGFLAWLEHVADWELRRRAGLDFPLQSPDAAIDPSEDAASLAAAMMLREQFAEDAPAVAGLFDAIVDTLTGTGNRH